MAPERSFSGVPVGTIVTSPGPLRSPWPSLKLDRNPCGTAAMPSSLINFRRRHVGERLAAWTEEHQARAVTASPCVVQDRERPPGERQAVIPLRLHARKRDGPHASVQIHLIPRCQAHLSGRRRRGRLGDTWHLDELFVTIQGRQQYVWRAVDEAGDVLGILVQPRRNRHAAVRFFRTLLKNQRHVPRRLITDKLRSYLAACRTVMPSVLNCTDQYANSRAEVSHQPTRQRERQMRRFKSAAQLQRFESVHSIVQNLFRVGRHLLQAAHHRLLRTRAFVEWDAVTCAC